MDSRTATGHYNVPKWAGKPESGLHLDVNKEGKLIQVSFCIHISIRSHHPRPSIIQMLAQPEQASWTLVYALCKINYTFSWHFDVQAVL